VRRFDIASRSLGARIAVAGGDVADLAVAGDGARVFATNPCPAGSCSGGAVAVIDTTTDTVASRLPLTGRIGKYTVPLQAGRLDAPGSRPVHRGHRRDRHDLPHPTQRIAAPALARAKAHQPLDTRPSTLFEHRRLPRAAHAHHPDAADQARQATTVICASASVRVAAHRSASVRVTVRPRCRSAVRHSAHHRITAGGSSTGLTCGSRRVQWTDRSVWKEESRMPTHEYVVGSEPREL
jgi:hypothetical protein